MQTAQRFRALIGVVAVLLGASGRPALAESAVLFNEIMYHPATNEVALEWVEFYNPMSYDMDVGGWRLDGAIAYAFPSNALIRARSYAVVALSPTGLIAATVGVTNAFGPFTGRLGNGGDALILRNNSGRVMDAVTYGADGDWPVAADGSGASLAKVSPETASDDAASWSWSRRAGGTPGMTNDAVTVVGLRFNEVAGASSATWFAELINAGTQSVNLAGCRVALGGAGGASYTLPAQMLAPGALGVVSGAQLGAQPLDEDALLLFDATSAVLDAARVEASPRARVPDGAGPWLRPAGTSSGAVNQVALRTEVVINEIFYHAQPAWVPFAESPEEWVELYNRGTGTVDLTGWAFVAGIDYEFPAGTTLAPGAFLVVAKDPGALAAKHPGIAIVGGFAGELADGGDRLVLHDAAGNPADDVRYWDGGRWPAYADGGGSSLELRDPDADNARPEAWAASDESGKTGWQTITYTGLATANNGPTQWHEFHLGLLGAGEVLIDDVSVIEDPGGANRELIQNGGFQTDLGKWRISGSHVGTRVVDPLNPTNFVLHLQALGATEHIVNHAETTLKSGATFVTINAGLSYRISLRAKWLAGSPQLHTRLYFNRLPQKTCLDTPALSGTPGATNSAFVGNMGPTFAGLSQTPVLPAAGQAVTVSVRAADPDGVASNVLRYAVNGGAWQAVALTNAGGGLYRGTVPGQSAGAVVQFHVQAWDGLGAMAMFPAGGTNSRALYQVADGRTSPDAKRNFRLIMTAADAAYMHGTTNLMSDRDLGCSVLYNDQELFHDVRVHLRGSLGSRQYDGAVGFVITFDPGDRLFRGTARSVAIDHKFGSASPAPQSALREPMVWQAMNRAGGGLPGSYNDIVYAITPRAGNTRTSLLILSRMDDAFAERLGDDGSDGPTHKLEFIYYPTTTAGDVEALKHMTDRNVFRGAVRDIGADPELYRPFFLLRNQRARDDYSAITNLCAVFSQTGTNFLGRVGDVIDVDQWLRAMAVPVLFGVLDVHATGEPHNAFLQGRPADGKLLYVPWDNDWPFFFSATSALVPFHGANPERYDLVKLVESPAWERLYYGHLVDIVQTAFNTNYLGPWIDRFQALTPEDNYAASAKAYIASRGAYLQSQVASLFAPAYPFTATGSVAAVAAASGTVQGQAWLNVHHITVAGLDEPLPLTWTAVGGGTNRVFQWSAPVALAPGANVLTILAYDFQGNVVGSNTVTITSTVAERPLRDNLRVTELMVDPAGGSDFEFIEFCNRGGAALDLREVAITDGISFAFAGSAVTNLGAGAHVVVVKHLAAFAARYGTNGMAVAGVYGGSLNNGGERVRVEGALQAEVLAFTYGNGRGWPLAAGGGGHSLVPRATAVADEDAGSLDYGGNWRASWRMHGSPGAADPEPGPGVTINEFVAHTDYSNAALPMYDSNDWIELYNGGTGTVDVSGWYLSDDLADLRKWAIPTNVAIAAGGWRAFDEVGGFHQPVTNGFGLNKAGEQVILAHLPGGGADRIVDAVAFKGQENGWSWGRFADGGTHGFALVPTLQASNAAPQAGVVIQAIQYHPKPTVAHPEDNGMDEYVVVSNAAAAPAQLWTEAGPWRLDGGIAYAFPTGTVLAAGAAVVVAPFNPTDAVARAAFLATHGMTSGAVTVLGPYVGQLSNRGERLAVERPQMGDLPGEGANWVIVDEAIYFHRAPWPAGAAGTGRALARRSPLRSGNDPDNWRAPLPDGMLEVHWAFDEGAGTNAADSSGNGNAGGLVDVNAGDGDTRPAWVAGQAGGGLRFDGADDAVRDGAVSVTGFPFTISAWVRCTDTNGARTAVYFGQGNATTRYFTIGINGGMAELVAQNSGNPNLRRSVTGVTALADGAWHHLAGVFAGDADTRVYVDGVLDGVVGDVVSFTSSVTRFSAGLRDRATPDAAWLGDIDDVRLYRGALDASDLGQVMAEGAGAGPVVDADSDGMPDVWEVQHFGATNAGMGGAGADWDGDGAGNLAEYEAGTDPTNGLSCFRVMLRDAGGAVVVELVTVDAGSGGAAYAGRARRYGIEATTNLAGGAWQPWGSVTEILGVGQVISATNAAPAGGWYYRGRARLE